MPVDKPVPSPCINVCALDANDVCMGCYRTALEITRWSMLDNSGKREVVEKALQRRRDDGAVF
jgi:hypothetical protein